MSLPSIYTDRETRMKERFLFISYSHEDSKLIFPLLNEAYDNGVNFWYDTAMVSGDNWKDVATQTLSDPNCVGAIVFISANSAVSSAVLKEVDYINKLLAEKEEFSVLPIYVDSDNLVDLTARIFQKDAMLGMQFSRSGIESFQRLVLYNAETGTEDRLYERLSNPEKAKLGVIEFAESVDCCELQTVSLSKTPLSKLEGYYTERGEHLLELGKFPFKKNETIAPIIWKFYEREGKDYFFVSKYALDFIKENEIEAFIKKIKSELAKYPFVDEVLLIKKEELQCDRELFGVFLPSDYADVHRAQAFRTFWVQDEGGLCLCNSLGYLIEDCPIYQEVNCGIRVVIKINEDKI